MKQKISPHSGQAPFIKRSITRRRFLQGTLGSVAISIGLPFLDIFLNAKGTALAQGTALPLRFGTFFWGLGYGLDINHWIPSGSGAGSNWEIPSSGHGLSGIARHKDYLTIFSNYSHVTPQGAGHIPQRGISVSASHNPAWVLDAVNGFRQQNMPLPSIDALIAQNWGDLGTIYPFLNMTLDIGSLYVGTSSWNTGGSYRTFKRSPLEVYNDIFRPLVGTPPPPNDSGPSLADVTYNFRKSVLDGALDELRSFSSQLTASDKQRLEAHTEGIRNLEQQLTRLHELDGTNSGVAQCSEVPEPQNYDSASEVAARHNVMAELLTYALACNLTRIFCYEFSPTQCNGQMPEIGLVGPEGVHDDFSHTDPAGMRTYLSFVMDRLGVLLDKLKATPEGAGNLLDQILMVGTGEYAGPHHHIGHPYLFAGKSGGRIRGNFHSRLGSTSNNDASRILLTAAHGAGVQLSRLGMPATTVTGASGGPSQTESYEATSPIPDVLT